MGLHFLLKNIERQALFTSIKVLRLMAFAGINLLIFIWLHILIWFPLTYVVVTIALSIVLSLDKSKAKNPVKAHLYKRAKIKLIK